MPRLWTPLENRPRFEEALLILSRDDTPILVVGNEGLSYADISPVELKRELYQNFSLMGQPRDKIKDLKGIFSAAGINGNSKVGLVGWKYFSAADSPNPRYQIDVPYYIVKHLIDLTGENNVMNATDFMLDPEYGLRIKLGWKELVSQEIAGTKSSQRVFNVIQNLKPGLTEMEASRFFAIDGEPVSAHPNINFGTRHVLMGLGSPTYSKRLHKGEVLNVALGYRSAMVARTGVFVDSRKEISPHMSGLVEDFYIPYFRALITWYESIKIGVTGGDVFDAVRASVGGLNKLGIGLNPGHLIHTDEWTHSIFFEGSSYPIVSGMAIQCDIIAFPGEPYVGVHVEDGILVADEDARTKIQTEFPECWGRIEKRRGFMKEVLGINLADEVLPVSNIQTILHPYMGNTRVLLSRM